VDAFRSPRRTGRVAAFGLRALAAADLRRDAGLDDRFALLRGGTARRAAFFRPAALERDGLVRAARLLALRGLLRCLERGPLFFFLGCFLDRAGMIEPGLPPRGPARDPGSTGRRAHPCSLPLVGQRG
jgi:hypothetical protein